MRTLLVTIALVVCLGTTGVWAQAADAGSPGGKPAASGDAGSAAGASDGAGAAASSSEDEFFGSSTVEAPQGTAEKQGVADVVEKEHVGLSGQLQAMSSYTVMRGSNGLSDNEFSNLVGGDFLVDARLQKGFKAFLDLNLGFVPGGTPVTHTFIIPPPSPLAGSLDAMESQDTALLVKEFFVDFNVANTVYFRVGRQVLKWGTGYFWNPTDLINIEHRSFTNTGALLTGVFGLRSDVVFSPSWHLYTFINLNDVKNDLADTAFAARSEFLVGAVEFAFSSWLRPNKLPVFGADLSMPLFWKMNLTSEASISWGDNQRQLDSSGNVISVGNKLVPKVDVGLSRSFDAFDVQDRVMTSVELFWNSDGYDTNMLGNPAFISGGYFQSGYYGQYYGAATVSIGSFGLSNMTLTLSGIANFSDLSATVLAGLSYAPVNNFTLSLQLGTFLGADNREYTFSIDPSTGALVNKAMFGILTATVAF
jgi:hypothetical protein